MATPLTRADPLDLCYVTGRAFCERPGWNLDPEKPMDCPICGAASAQWIDPPSFDAKSIRCFECGDYDITGNTWDLDLLTLEQRRKALAKAQRVAHADRRPRITSYVIEPSSTDAGLGKRT